ncbi:MAG: isochorismate synthase [Rhodocyclaceae bacterium]|nr:isochorismate synthase [Rhodocyclaceae bacterium]
MNGLLGATDIAGLRRRLGERLAGAPDEALVSVTLELGPGREDWLGLLCPNRGSFHYWAVPAEDDYRLGLGRALTLRASGPRRFARLGEGFRRASASWRHEEAGAPAPLAFLGFAFDEEEDERMPCSELAVPAVLLQCRGGRRWASFTALAREGLGAVEGWFSLLEHGSEGVQGGHWWRRDTGFSDRMWLARVDAALHDIATGHLEKVVLSRSAHLIGQERFALGALLSCLLTEHGGGTLFAVGRGEGAFLGLTPERLVSLCRTRASADALAGTAWQQGEGGQGRKESAMPLSDEKNRREQQLVVDAVALALAPLCRELSVPDSPHVLRHARVQHLRSRIEGAVRPGVALLDLVAALHPTPAVGGLPGSAARDWLRRHGERRPDWYTGGFGWMTPDGEGEVRVALRCASVSGAEARLYAGAGIVAGSAPERELMETEAKLATLLDAFERYRALGPGLPGEPLLRTGT